MTFEKSSTRRTRRRSGPATVARHAVAKQITEADAVEQITALWSRLLHLSGHSSLNEVVAAAYDWDLEAEAAAAYSELGNLGWLCGLPTLPCCNSHDQDKIVDFISGIERIVQTRKLPD